MPLTRSVVFGDTAPAACRAGARTRPVERLRVHGPAIDFRELCRLAVRPSTRLLVLDLDRTLHLGRNMGELLGWEICAHLGYGPAYLEELEVGRRGGRTFVVPSRPLALLRYLLLGARLWGPPGLFYLVWGRIAWRWRPLRRRAFVRFGPEAVRAVQQVPQLTLLRQLDGLADDVAGELAARVFRRYGADQTIERDDIAWLRQRCPDLRVVLCSASPRPVVATAAALIGADAIVCTEGVRINAGAAKVDALRARFPDLSASVGITDTGYGEDHSWTELFETVIDVNSDAPFPPIVDAASPTRAIHSALLLTRAERAARPWLDPRRRTPPPRAVDVGAAELAAALGPLAGEIERLARAVDALGAELGPARARARAEFLRSAPSRRRAVERRVAEIERPLSEAACALGLALEEARRAAGALAARQE